MHFILVSSKFDGEIELKYNENGVLEKFENRAKLDTEMIKWFFKYFPLTTGVLSWLIENTKTLRLKEVPIDTSFEAFWEKYDRKVNKKRCKPIYEKLSDSEQIQCVMAIKQYDFFLGRYPTRAKMDPENWIKNAGWETDWSKIK